MKAKITAYKSLNNDSFGVKATEIITSTINSTEPLFASPPYPPATLEAAVESYNSLLIASENGNRQVIEQRNQQRDVVTNFLNEIALWASYQVRNQPNAAMLLSSLGFVPSKVGRTPVTEITAPENVRSAVSQEPGCINMEWSAVPHAQCYAIEIVEGGAGIDAAWKHHGFSTKVKHVLSGLDRGKVYSIRLRTFHNSIGYSTPSEIITCMAG